MMENEQFYVFDWDAVFDVDDYLHFYDDTLRAERTEHQVDVLEAHMRLLPGMRILDLGCGHGRHSLALARRGQNVVGIDRTAGFIELAKRDAEAEHLAVSFVQGDMRELDDVEAYDRVICLFDVFGLHRDEENHDVLCRIARALRPGGMVCLDVRNRDWMLRGLLPVTVMQKGPDLMVDRHVFDPISGRLVDYRLMVRGGVTKEARFSVRLYHFSELRALCASAGLVVQEAFGSWDGDPIGLGQNRMVLFCEKA
jgi:ubiquinone/menaquinone biosynthesis C-methylase UbiE